MASALYVHVPFCASRCGYCNFYSGEPLGLAGEYPAWVLREGALRRRASPGPLSTVYLGGGTPGLLGPRGVGQILDGARELWGLDADAEVTVEVNPSTGVNLEDLRRLGVNRLSLGIQALDDRLLTWLGRRHDASTALETLERAGDVGFDRVSADLLYGVPGLRPRELAAWVERLAERGVSHFSAYSLELHPGTQLERRVSAGSSSPCPPEAEQAQWEALVAAADARGYRLYEVSNFSRPGCESRHNRVYWERRPYLGLGPGAHSFMPELGSWGRRSWNHPDLRAYGDAVCRDTLPPGAAEDLTRSEALLEALFLALRRTAQLSAVALGEEFGLNPESVQAVFLALADRRLLVATGSATWEPSRDALRRADGLALWAHERLLAAQFRSP